MATTSPLDWVNDVDDNCAGWGPTDPPQQFSSVPFTPFNKGDKLGKAADWTNSSYQYRSRFSSNIDTEFNFYHVEDDEEFKLVDTSIKPKQKGKKFYNYHKRQTDNRSDRSRNSSTNTRKYGKGNKHYGYHQNSRYNRYKNRRYNAYQHDSKRQFAASIEVQDSWKLLETITFDTLNDQAATVENTTDLKKFGNLEYFDQQYTNVSTRNEKPLEKTDRLFFSENTIDDPIIRDLMYAKEGNVYATDVVLAALMACTRSVYSWDLIVQRVGNNLIFDKRDNSQFDLLTVNETSSQPPVEDDKNPRNTPSALAVEATEINNNFSQQVLQSDNKYGFGEENPFHEGDGEPAATGYRYRKWELEDDVKLVARCEIDGINNKKGKNKLLSIKALNEYDTKATNWRQKVDAQKGAVLATELKNNSNKIGRWAAQAVLAGVDTIILGYVSRLPSSELSHTILGTQIYKPLEFARQMRFNVENGWGSLKYIIDSCLKLPEGKYLLMKVPNKTHLELYSVPDNAFEEESDEE